jgi:hypothetical protein
VDVGADVGCIVSGSLGFDVGAVVGCLLEEAQTPAHWSVAWYEALWVFWRGLNRLVRWRRCWLRRR